MPIDQKKLHRLVESIASGKFKSEEEMLTTTVNEIVGNENIDITGGRIWKLNTQTETYQLLYQTGKIGKIDTTFQIDIHRYPLLDFCTSLLTPWIVSPVQCYWYATFSIVGLGTLLLLEHRVPFLRVSNPWFGEAAPELGSIPLLIAFVLISSVLYASTFLATSIMSRFRKREDVVRNLSQNLQKALTRMETLYEATTMMVTSYNLQEVLDLLLRDCVRLMEAKGAALRLVQRGTNELLPVVSYGLSEAYLNKGPVTVDDGLVPRTPDDVILVDDVEKDPRLCYGKESYREGIRSIISLPLVSKGQITGNLRLYAKTRHHFTRMKYLS